MNTRLILALTYSLTLHALFLLVFRGGTSLGTVVDPNLPLTVWLTPAQPLSALVDEPPVPEVRRASKLFNSSAVGVEVAHDNAEIENQYFLASEVDVKAQPISIPMLVYPDIAQVRRIAGVVRLQVLINEYGKIDRVIMIESLPPSVFDQAAIDALLVTSYTPAMKAGRSVKSQKLVEIQFEPYELINQP